VRWEVQAVDDVLKSVERGERLLFVERATQAREVVTELGDLKALEPELRDRARLLAMRADVLLDVAADEIALSAIRARAAASAPRWRASFSAELAARLTDKRCDALAREAAQEAIDVLPTSAIGHDALARVHLSFDRRADALAAYELALALDDSWRAQLGLVRVAYVTGEFDRARETIAKVDATDATRVPLMRWRSTLARLDRDWTRGLELIDEIIEHTRGGFRHRWDLLARASTLDWLGRRADAIEAYRGVWREEEDDSCGRFAREVLNHIERGGGGKRTLLPAFPTTTQKRNYCGPAVLELVLRHLGVDADQDTIATTVKLPDGGSPMIRIVRYLETQGLATRRFEATTERVRACMELGLPVIVQEEYSTTQHVAVVVGVDEELGLFFVQDPMTHVTAERLFGTEERLGALFRHAATVAHKKDDAEIAAKLDAAGVCDLDHIRLVDECDDDEVTRDAQAVLSRCERAVALCEDYPLAWHRQAWELLWLARRYDSPANVNRFLSMLRSVRVRYGQSEWPHQVHASYLMWQKRHEEALIEYEDALRLDPGDANNAQYIAELHMECDRPADATAGWWRALGLDPAHLRATENFASHALEQGFTGLAEHLSKCALAMAPKNPFNHCTASRVADKLGRSDEAVAHARKCVAVDGEWVAGKRHLATLLRRRPETRDEALEIVTGLAKRWKGWFAPRLEAASILREMGRVDDAVALLDEGIAGASDEPTDLLREACEALLDVGRSADCLAFARRVVEKRGSMELELVLLDMLGRERREAEATVLARKLIEKHGDMGHTVAEASTWLPDDEAEALLRKIVDLAPTYREARGRLVARLVARKPEDAVKVSFGPGAESSGWVLRMRATAQNELGRFDDAEKTARSAYEHVGQPQWVVVEFVRARVRDGDPAEALAKLRASGDDGEIATRGRAALAVALGDRELALDQLGHQPKTDVAAAKLLVHAAEADETLRDALEERLRAAADAEGTSDADERWLRAALAGSRGARGDDEAFAKALAEGKRADQVLPMRASIDARRHRVLHERIVARAAELDADHPLVLLARANLASLAGDGEQARSILDRAVETYPLEHSTWEDSGCELMLDLDPRGHERLDRVMTMSTRCYEARTVGAISLLVRGKRDEARPHLLAARATRCGYGTPLSQAIWLAVGLAALNEDRAALDAAIASHWRKDAKLWDALRA
jgi:tetratricopeptide (TPR) repeat protein